MFTFFSIHHVHIMYELSDYTDPICTKNLPKCNAQEAELQSIRPAFRPSTPWPHGPSVGVAKLKIDPGGIGVFLGWNFRGKISSTAGFFEAKFACFSVKNDVDGREKSHFFHENVRMSTKKWNFRINFFLNLRNKRSLVRLAAWWHQWHMTSCCSLFVH